MSEPKFTPGPWQFVYGNLYDYGEDFEADGFSILMAGARLVHPDESGDDRCRDRVGDTFTIHEIRYAESVYPEGGRRAEAEANARLIAAAPELYEALDSLVNAGRTLNLQTAENAVDRAFAVLAKARGETAPSEQKRRNG